MAFQWHPSAQYKALKPKFWESLRMPHISTCVQLPKRLIIYPHEICFISWPIPGDMSTRLSVFTSFVVDEEKKDATAFLSIWNVNVQSFSSFFFSYLFWSLVERNERRSSSSFFFFTKQQLDGFTSPRGRTHNNPKSFTGEKGGKKRASRRVQKKDFLLYSSSSSSLMERMRGFLAGATSTPIAYYKFFRVGSGR